MISSSYHCNKIFLTIAIALTFSAFGSALMCNQCYYKSTHPKAQQVCGNDTVNCTTGYCYSVSYTRSRDGTLIIARSCDSTNVNDKFCPDPDVFCEKEISKNNSKSCFGVCCSTDNCNNYTPTSATGIMVAKFSMCVMVILGLFLA
ncbi:Hypothetical predicted protein [Paramuricea clavata]|uniref:Uncharacterized protein n=2 Tax=Paramuricea clavata TaxID=317549 RepID=A0A6S7LPE9_PARCT|nr:Hypothetical predicted protein [Paramuricea clavata]